MEIATYKSNTPNNLHENQLSEPQNDGKSESNALLSKEKRKGCNKTV